MTEIHNLDEVRHVALLDTAVHCLTLDGAAAAIVTAARDGRRMHVCVRDAHGLVRARRDAALAEAHRTAGLVTADGMPLVWLQRLAGARWAERVYGPDLMDRVCDLGRAAGLRHAFLGGAPGVAARAAADLARRHPGLAVTLADTLPHRPAGHRPQPGEDAAALAALRAAPADVLWVGLGTPKQELWMRANRGHAAATVMIGVGAAFDFAAGTVPQAPRWMQRSGLEWAFRLAVEPRRLGPRYLRTLPVFAALAMHDLLRRRPA